jgi:kynurenine formamidase
MWSEAPSRDELLAYLEERTNRGRWGEDDQLGTLNLVTPQKRLSAAGLVQSGRTVSLAREFPKTPGPSNPNPAQHFMRINDRGDHGTVTDYLGTAFHGYQSTHMDALCHVFAKEGFWGGRDPKQTVTTDGSAWCDITAWREGFVTRGVLLDVPRHRGVAFVNQEEPIHAWELEAVAKAQDVQLLPGDAVLCYGGRDAWWASGPEWVADPPRRPGVHGSCLAFIREHDVALWGWDLMELWPNGYGLPFTIHYSIPYFGLALLDNALLEPLAQACAEEQRYEFMLVVAPLRVAGGTGSPVNPLAIF